MGNGLVSFCSGNQLTEGRPPGNSALFPRITAKVGISITVEIIGKDIWETDCLSEMLHIFAVAFIYP